MKDVDVLSRHIGPIIYRYVAIVFRMRTKDIYLRTFFYNFEVLLIYSNHLHVTDSSLLLEHSTNPTLLTHIIL